MSKVTIIIPIYNAEKYLKNCIKSIVIQEYEDMEVLLIDDGSTDNSFWLCKQFEEEYAAWCLDEACMYVKARIDDGEEPVFKKKYTSFSSIYGDLKKGGVICP